MGITQHRLGTANVQQIVNLLLLRGNFGKPGAGICPVRGHSNVQGDRTMGIDEKPKPELLDQLKKVFGFEPPRARGHHVVDAVQAMVDGRAKVFIGLGGNFVRAVPDWTVAEAAMRRLRLTVAISTKLNRGHLVHGEQALILPCLARSDIDMQAGGRQSVTVEDSMSMVHASSGLVEPPSEHLKSEVAIVCGMAKATLPDCGIDWDSFVADYNRIRDKIEAVFPELFADFNERIRQPGRLSPDHSAARAGLEHRHGPRQFSGLSRGRRRPTGLRSRPCFGSRHCEATISTTRRSTVSTTAIAACSAAAWWCS